MKDSTKCIPFFANEIGLNPDWTFLGAEKTLRFGENKINQFREGLVIKLPIFYIAREVKLLHVLSKSPWAVSSALVTFDVIHFAVLAALRILAGNSYIVRWQ